MRTWSMGTPSLTRRGTEKRHTSKVINAWEVAIPTMTVGEVAEIVCTSDYGYGDKGFHPIVPPKASLRYEVELLGTWEPAGSALQRIEAAGIKKDEGNDLYKKSAFEQALYAYKKGRDYVIELWDCEPEELEQCRELVIALQLNISACYLKLREFDNAVEVANNVLQRDPSNVKAYYRIGQAYLEKAEFEKGIEYLETGVKMTSDPDLKNMLATLKHKQDTWFRNSKSVFRKMVS
ncbi:cytochrome P450 monooxygenase 9 [Apophysomyces sp. BC1015]|nr:cytochrome P450 monooxygenase 9 [Apophysomyces sp. BC1015]